MSVTVRQRGESWQALVRVQISGQKFEQSRSFPTERLAADWGHRLDQEIRARGIPQRRLSTGTLGDLLDDYVEELRKHHKLRRQRELSLTRLQGYPVARAKLRDLCAHDFVKFAQARRADDKAGPATILHDLADFRSVLASAKSMFNLDIDASAVVEAVKTTGRLGVAAESQKRDRRPTSHELEALRADFRRVRTHPSALVDMEAFIDLAVALPRRREELCTMRWVDYTGVTLILRETKHPTRMRNEVVPVPAEAAAIIDRQPKVSEYIFPYKPETVSAAFQRACKRLGIEDLHLHDLRHEGISRLFEAGLQIQEVALISGHESWTQLKRYTQIKPEHVLTKINARSQRTQEAPPQPQRP